MANEKFSTLAITYDMDAVMNSVMNDIELTDKNKEVIRRDWYYDAAKGKVCFVFMTMEKK